MKRFTETKKWEDGWFSKLPIKYKVLWLYLCDSCDAAGVWEPNHALAEFFTGFKSLNWSEAAHKLDKNIRILKNGKWWLPGFVVFQYGEELKPAANVHMSCINLLQKHGLWADYLQWLDLRAKTKAQDGLNDTMAIPLSWDKVKVEVKVKAKVGITEAPNSHAGVVGVAEIYAAYPRKIGSQVARKAIERAFERIVIEQAKAGLTFNAVPAWLLARVQEYAAAVATWPASDRQYIPHPATWFNRGSYDDDPATWKRDGGSSKGRASFA